MGEARGEHRVYVSETRTWLQAADVYSDDIPMIQAAALCAIANALLAIDATLRDQFETGGIP